MLSINVQVFAEKLGRGWGGGRSVRLLSWWNDAKAMSPGKRSHDCCRDTQATCRRQDTINCSEHVDSKPVNNSTNRTTASVS